MYSSVLLVLSWCSPRPSSIYYDVSPGSPSRWDCHSRSCISTQYVHNRARSEGSISKGYGIEEVIEFCVDFIPNLKSIGVPQSRHEGRLRGNSTIGKKAMICRDGHSFTQAHYTVLQSSTLVAPYISEHKNILRSQHLGQSKSWLHRNMWRHSAVGCEHMSGKMTLLLKIRCTCWPAHHL